MKELQRFLDIIEEKNLSIEDVIKLINGTKEFSKVKSEADEEITLAVDYRRNVKIMIKAGDYAKVDNELIYAYKRFYSPSVTRKKIETVIKLFHFSEEMLSDDVIKEIDKAGYIPGTLHDLLTLGEVYPYLQRQFPIIALGSVKRSQANVRQVPGLSITSRERLLEVAYDGHEWKKDCRFIALPKNAFSN
jgi:hypothetical protein